MDQRETTQLKQGLRAKQIAGKEGILPISLSTWWEGVKTGRYPQPTKLGPRITVWNRDDIMALLKSPATEKQGG